MYAGITNHMDGSSCIQLAIVKLFIGNQLRLLLLKTLLLLCHSHELLKLEVHRNALVCSGHGIFGAAIAIT